jgi:hypothetical protein
VTAGRATTAIHIAQADQSAGLQRGGRVIPELRATLAMRDHHGQHRARHGVQHHGGRSQHFDERETRLKEALAIIDKVTVDNMPLRNQLLKQLGPDAA